MKYGLFISLSAIEKAARAAAPLALALLVAGVASACPTCTDGLAQNDPQGQSIAAGFYYSILFMMAMPFAILGTFGGMAYLSIRRAQQARTTEEAGVDASPILQTVESMGVR
jgi:p-aminobenzoyl-glutamate transporter AbgT